MDGCCDQFNNKGPVQPGARSLNEQQTAAIHLLLQLSRRRLGDAASANSEYLNLNRIVKREFLGNHLCSKFVDPWEATFEH